MAESFTWNGFPGGTGTCRVVPLCQSTLVLDDQLTIYPGDKAVTSRRPSYTFIIRHDSNGKTLLFDLGIPKNWLSYIDEKWRALEEEEMKVEIGCDLDEMVESGGVKKEDVDILLISHKHWDHTGSPSSFPNAVMYLGSTEVPHIPALAGVPASRINTISWSADSHPPLLSFENSLDLFSDGSVVILNAKGHTPGHIATLVRTNPGEYVLLGSDVCHHHLLLSQKEEVLAKGYKLGMPPVEERTADASLGSNYEDYEESSKTLARLMVCEKRDDILVVLAHNEKQWELFGGGNGTKDGWGPELKGWKEKGLKIAF